MTDPGPTPGLSPRFDKLRGMEPSQVRRHVRESIERARQASAARRAANDAASRAWASARDALIVPVWQQALQALRAEGHRFQISTPSDAVRVSSEKTPQDGVELALDTTGASPVVVLRATQARGRQVLSEERAAASGTEAIATLTEEQALAWLLDALIPLFER
jgi:hypothetical protein